MQKYYIIVAHDGSEVIDSTLEAGDRIAAMNYQEERYIREQKRKAKNNRKYAENPLYKLAGLCGLV